MSARAQRKQLRRELKARRQELRRQLPQMRRAARARVAQLPVVRKARSKRRLRRAAALVLLALIALFARCECQPAPAAEVEAIAPEPETPAPLPEQKVKAPRPGPLHAGAKKLPRARFATEAREAPPWMDEYRIQVAARSPRLARCFDGADRPGALRWVASVNPGSGAVSEHELEPVGEAGDIGRDQRECLLAALSSPPYRLTAPGQQALPDRVGLVIEF